MGVTSNYNAEEKFQIALRMAWHLKQPLETLEFSFSKPMLKFMPF